MVRESKRTRASGGIKTVIIYNYTTHSPFIESCLLVSCTPDQECGPDDVRVPSSLIGWQRYSLWSTIIAIFAVLNGTFYQLPLQSRALPTSLPFLCTLYV